MGILEISPRGAAGWVEGGVGEARKAGGILQAAARAILHPSTPSHASKGHPNSSSHCSLTPRGPAISKVVGHGDKEHYAGDFRKSPHVELAHPVQPRLGVGPLRYGAPTPVYGFGLLSGHPPTPPNHLLPIPVSGQIPFLLRPVPRQPYRRVHPHTPLLQDGDVFPGGKARP